ncbi:hypothetical protein Tsubulata_042378 [Turnera subulata]|uniref:Uncharacterized protein n=1 Tax=Turnera subulata TaxID=218843 RepID=A0A9Q0IZB0_9ROSI|nr:hypothetical protein Tsubulata_042378 [Turnera subulata]
MYEKRKGVVQHPLVQAPTQQQQHEPIRQRPIRAPFALSPARPLPGRQLALPHLRAPPPHHDAHPPPHLRLPPPPEPPTDVGCAAEILRHERLAGDRFFLKCKGRERVSGRQLGAHQALLRRAGGVARRQALLCPRGRRGSGGGGGGLSERRDPAVQPAKREAG